MILSKWQNSIFNSFSSKHGDILLNLHLTWFLKVTVVGFPGFSYAKEILFHGLDVHGGAVALWKPGTTLTPAVIILTDKLSLWIAGNVAQGCLYKTLLKIVWKEDLKPLKTKAINQFVLSKKVKIVQILVYCINKPCIFNTAFKSYLSIKLKDLWFFH